MGKRVELKYKGNTIRVNVRFRREMHGWVFRTFVIRPDADKEQIKPIDSLCSYGSKEKAEKEGVAFGKKIINVEIGPS
jgi:hypothetical protein